MSEALWTEVDQYLADHLLPEDPVLTKALERNAQAELPAIDVSPLQGKGLYLLAKIQGARRILEIGTLGGYSTIWLARALPADGLLVTLELEEKHAEVARENLAAAGLVDRVDIMTGLAADSLARLLSECGEPFDFVFIDADKVSTADYYEQAMALCRSGSVIIADNVVRKGEVAQAHSEDIGVQGMRRFMDVLANDRRVEATAVQTIGLKGHDGCALIRVL